MLLKFDQHILKEKTNSKLFWEKPESQFVFSLANSQCNFCRKELAAVEQSKCRSNHGKPSRLLQEVDPIECVPVKSVQALSFEYFVYVELSSKVSRDFQGKQTWLPSKAL